jgi:hypothetical protein
MIGAELGGFPFNTINLDSTALLFAPIPVEVA